jgi:hypothetical protein
MAVPGRKRLAGAIVSSPDDRRAAPPSLSRAVGAPSLHTRSAKLNLRLLGAPLDKRQKVPTVNMYCRERLQCCRSMFIAMLRIRIHRIHVFLGLLDPDPDPSILSLSKNSKKNLDF